jgi:aquaporin Z
LQQLWLFWAAPIIGGLIGGGLYKWLNSEEKVDIAGDA